MRHVLGRRHRLGFDRDWCFRNAQMVLGCVIPWCRALSPRVDDAAAHSFTDGVVGSSPAPSALEMTEERLLLPRRMAFLALESCFCSQFFLWVTEGVDTISDTLCAPSMSSDMSQSNALREKLASVANGPSETMLSRAVRPPSRELSRIDGSMVVLSQQLCSRRTWRGGFDGVCVATWAAA